MPESQGNFSPLQPYPVQVSQTQPAAIPYRDGMPVKGWLQMDTIKAHADGEWLDVPAPAGWTRLRKDTPAQWKRETGFAAYARYRHEATGMVLSGGQSLRFVEVSLPRLLHGTNCSVIRDQEELSKALSLICPLLRQVVSGPLLYHFTRCDLAWNLPLAAGDVKARLQRAQHAWFRGLDKNPRRNVEYRGNDNFTLKGAGKQLCLYDKGLEAYGLPGFLRPELRLQNPLLRQKLGTTFQERVFGLLKLDFQTCYSVWRESLFAFANGQELFGPYCPPDAPLICNQNPGSGRADTAAQAACSTVQPLPQAAQQTKPRGLVAV